MAKTDDNTLLTVHAAVQDEPDPRDACLVVIHGSHLGQKYALKADVITIGRAETSDISLDEEDISRNHCQLIHRDNSACVLDLGSTNGTFVNDRPVREYLLRDGDLIKVGCTIFKYILSGNIESAYHEEIYNLSTTDGLTQTYNKRYLIETLDREISRARRYGRELSFLMLDIDHFKRINDFFGHPAGDYVLKRLAAMIRSRIRREDILARYGGEEFGIILPEVDLAGARLCAEKIRKLVEHAEYVFEGLTLPVTISIGVAASSPEVLDSTELIEAADKYLYEAKRMGRNRVCG